MATRSGAPPQPPQQFAAPSQPPPAAPVAPAAAAPSDSILEAVAAELQQRGITLTGEVLGRGTYGIVYKGRVVGADSRVSAVAVKLLHSFSHGHYYRDEAAQHAVANSAGGGLPIVFLDDLPTGPILVTPCIPAQSFKSLVRTSSMDVVRSYMASLLLDLSRMASVGVVHRDIKPRNFLFDAKTGVGWVIDFGLAEPAEAIMRRADRLRFQADLSAATATALMPIAAAAAGAGSGAALSRAASSSHRANSAAPVVFVPALSSIEGSGHGHSAASAATLPFSTSTFCSSSSSSAASSATLNAPALAPALAPAPSPDYAPSPPAPTPAHANAHAPTPPARAPVPAPGMAAELARCRAVTQRVLAAQRASGSAALAGLHRSLMRALSGFTALASSGGGEDEGGDRGASEGPGVGSDAVAGANADAYTEPTQAPEPLGAAADAFGARQSVERLREAARPGLLGVAAVQGAVLVDRRHQAQLAELELAQAQAQAQAQQQRFGAGAGAGQGSREREWAEAADPHASQSTRGGNGPGPGPGPGPSPQQTPQQEALAQAGLVAARLQLALDAQVAARAGTPGFRAPEVLLGFAEQTPAVDAWSAGVTLMCLLMRRETLFPGRSDAEHALLIMALMGDAFVQGMADGCGKIVSGLPLPPARAAPSPAPSPAPTPLVSVSSADAEAAAASNLLRMSVNVTVGLRNLVGDARSAAEEPALSHALHLAMCLLNPDPQQRLSAAMAVALHPFFRPAAAPPLTATSTAVRRKRVRPLEDAVHRVLAGGRADTWGRLSHIGLGNLATAAPPPGSVARGYWKADNEASDSDSDALDDDGAAAVSPQPAPASEPAPAPAPAAAAAEGDSEEDGEGEADAVAASEAEQLASGRGGAAGSEASGDRKSGGRL